MASGFQIHKLNHFLKWKKKIALVIINLSMVWFEPLKAIRVPTEKLSQLTEDEVPGEEV